MRELYQHNKTGKELIVLFNVFETQECICGVDNQYKCDVKHYTCLDLNYNRETTTIDNLDKNYTLVTNPEGKAKQVLDYIKMSK